MRNSNSEADLRVIVLQRFERGEPAGLPAGESRALFPMVKGASALVLASWASRLWPSRNGSG